MAVYKLLSEEYDEIDYVANNLNETLMLIGYGAFITGKPRNIFYKSLFTIWTNHPHRNLQNTPNS